MADTLGPQNRRVEADNTQLGIVFLTHLHISIYLHNSGGSCRVITTNQGNLTGHLVFSIRNAVHIAKTGMKLNQ